jgi:hypothetical protein
MAFNKIYRRIIYTEIPPLRSGGEHLWRQA